jgi:hypothetical protein
MKIKKYPTGETALPDRAVWTVSRRGGCVREAVSAGAVRYQCITRDVLIVAVHDRIFAGDNKESNGLSHGWRKSFEAFDFR